ncbi:MAG: FHA domain-containing protein [Cyanobacteria bacterium J06641_5]
MAPQASHVFVIRDLAKSEASDIEPFKLTEDRLRIGRSLRADIQVSGFDCSRIHATLVRERNEHGQFCYTLHDGDLSAGRSSANGTYVNGQQISEHRLCNGDRILFGTQVEATYWYVPVKTPPPLPETYGDTQTLSDT